VLLYLGSLGPFHASAWYVVAAMGLLLYCGGFTMWLVALGLGRRAGEAYRLPPLTYLTPVLAVLLGRILLHDSVGPGFWQGAALIAAGNLVIVLRRGMPKAAKPVAETPRPSH
jgi:drug/metabolite transporter (DMT)-like permease